MDVHFSQDVESRLRQLASDRGTDAEQFVRETIGRVLDDRARFVSAVERGIDEADRGKLIDHVDVRLRIGRLFT